MNASLRCPGRFLRCALFSTLTLTCTVAPLAPLSAETWSYLMYSDPKLTPYLAPEEIPHAALVTWQQALERSEDIELLSVVAIDAARAHDTEAIDLSSLIPVVWQRFSDAPSAQVRINMFRLLAKLSNTPPDSKWCDAFAKAADEDVSLAPDVELALARWNYEPRRKVWRQHFADPNESLRRRVLAARALAIVKDAESRQNLLDVAVDAEAPLTLRLAAATAAARASGDADDPLELAKTLINEADEPTGKWVAARMLSRARHEASMAVLRELVLDGDLGASAIACRRLARRWPQEVVQLGKQLLDHPSSRVRMTAVACIGEHGAAARPKLLGPYLADRHPEVREAAGAELVELGKLGMLKEVQEQVRLALQGDRWQGHAQGCRVADELSYIGACPLALKLLDAEIDHSRKAACYFLGRNLPAEDMRAIDVFFNKLLDARVPNGSNPVARDAEILLVMQAFGRTKHASADNILRDFIPKSVPFPPIIREAAIWSLGKIHEGKAPKDLGQQLAERAADVMSMNPEANSVRAMSVIALGHMNNKDQLPVLRRFPLGKDTRFGVCLGWTLEQLTGEAPEFPRPWRRVKLDFNVFPLLQYFEP